MANIAIDDFIKAFPLFEPVVKFKWITPNAEKEIVTIARVSSENPNNDDTALLKKLWDMGHVSPFQMANLCVEVQTSREVGRQLMRHWSMNNVMLDVQELSQRYQKLRPTLDISKKPPIPDSEGVVEVEAETYYPFFCKNARFAMTRNRQASWSPSPSDVNKPLGEIWSSYCVSPCPDDLKLRTYKEFNDEFVASQKEEWVGLVYKYTHSISTGMAKEVARTFLPEGMTPTTFYINGTMRSWMHYLIGRAFNTTGISQFEHTQVAKAILEIVKIETPLIYTILITSNEN
jgi:thymidylate synthase (FAD)